jgi:hypothetical protein
MIDLMSATQTAVYQALVSGGLSIPVYDHVKQDTQPNFIKIGHISCANEGTKEDQQERFEVEIHAIYRGSDRGELLGIMHEVRKTLDREPLAFNGVSFWQPDFLTAMVSDAGPDGVTYAGISTFEVVAEPA